MMTNLFDKFTFKSLLQQQSRRRKMDVIRIFSRFDSIQKLLDVTKEELLSIKGIGKVKAKQIISALKLARMNPAIVENRFVIRGPEDAYNYLKDMQYLNNEEFVVLGLNTKNEVTFRKLGKGTEKQTCEVVMK